MSASDREIETAEKTKAVTVSEEMLEKARRNGHDPTQIADEIDTFARRIIAVGPRGPRAATSTTWTLLLSFGGETLVLLAALIAMWPIGAFGIDGERRLFLLVLFAGMLGATIAGLIGLLEDCGDDGVYAREIPLRVALPVVGAGVAMVFYTAIRGGLLTAPTGEGNTSELINPYGVVGISALVGLFLPGAIQRLTAISKVVFGEDETARLPRN
jgi:hypothetical protein